MQNFIKMIRGDATRELMRRPNEFSLMAIIATEVKRTDGFSADGLRAGDALLTHRDTGLSRKQFRTASKNLSEWGFVTAIGTHSGTIFRIVRSEIFDPNIISPQPIKKIGANQGPTKAPVIPINYTITREKGANQKDRGQPRANQSACNSNKLHHHPGKRGQPYYNKEKRISCSFSKEKEPAGAGSFLNKLKFKMPENTQDIIDLCVEIDRLSSLNCKKMNSWAFVQQKVNQRGHPRAVVEALGYVVKAWDIIDDPWAIAHNIFTIRSPNYNERDWIEKSSEFKQAWDSPEVAAIIRSSGIGRQING